MYDPFNEYPHVIELGSLEVVSAYPRKQERFKSEKTIHGFMDTPTTNEQLLYAQMQNNFDRNLYTPYGIAIDENKTLFRYDGRVYECVGAPVDQGGIHEVNLTKLRVRPIG